MSRAGTSTDNQINESLNSWIKEELFIDFYIKIIIIYIYNASLFP